MPRLLAAALLAALLGAGHAIAQPLTPSQLAPAIDAVVAGKLEERALLLGCSANDAALREKAMEGWRTMRATLAALLWAADFPPEHVRGAMARTDPAQLAPAPDAQRGRCEQPAVVARREEFSAATWSNELRAMFKALQLPSTVRPPTDEQWTRVKAVVAREAAAQDRMLNCLGVAGADFLPLAMSDWARAVGDSRVILESAGFPRDEIAALFDPIAPNMLYKAAADRAVQREACMKEREWRDRYATFTAGAIFFDIREIVTGKR